MYVLWIILKIVFILNAQPSYVLKTFYLSNFCLKIERFCTKKNPNLCVLLEIMVLLDLNLFQDVLSRALGTIVDLLQLTTFRQTLVK